MMQTVLWVMSLLMSIYYDFSNLLPHASVEYRIILGFILFLLVELILDAINITIGMEGKTLEDTEFNVSCFVGIALLTLTIITVIFLIRIQQNLLFYIVIMGALMKFGMHSLTIYINANKVLSEDDGEYEYAEI